MNADETDAAQMGKAPQMEQMKQMGQI